MTDEPDSMLVVEKGLPGVRVIPLDQQVRILGSSASADVYVDNTYVSRMHAEIIRERERFRVRDPGSKNGTFVNGARLTGDDHILKSGDRVELAEGQVVMRFQTRGSTLSLRTTPSPGDAALVVDDKPHEVWVGGKRVEPPLSRKEFDVLNLLSRRRGEACSKDDIAAAGWPERGEGDVGDQEIEQTVRRIRLRVEPDPSRPRYVVTVRGYGYKLAGEQRTEG